MRRGLARRGGDAEGGEIGDGANEFEPVRRFASTTAGSTAAKDSG
jgi:hypothetical protein